ncbi:MAG TPA: ethanolamine utilization protein EutN [Caldithrix abyssi]|uniref:Ethanolamine utilization protein EutN n=1 Tax=Caldithrix abyssi TaxID=187145 RepID=A0A7V5RMY1_CALAY|nr:ethanolamine utilization protein EutN [Caldithrix abyssi]
MLLAKTIGSIWATQKDPQLDGLKLLLIQPISMKREPLGTPLIAVDSVGAGTGEIVFYITASEAVIPLQKKPALADATIIGIVDKIELENDPEK